MNDQRLTPADLASALARRGSLPRRYCEDFVRSFFDVIEDGLVHDNLVKIKGFGTFKIVDIDARESVNVSTGERFEIASHTKVSFTPDAALRDAVNKPFVAFQTVILNEGTDTKDMERLWDSVPTEEPATVESATEEPVAEAPVVEEPVAEAPVAEAPVVEAPVVEAPVVEKPKAAEPAAEKPAAEKPAAEKPAEKPAAEKPAEKPAETPAEKPAAEVPATPAPACEKPCRCHCFWHTLLWLLTACLFLILGYCAAYYWRPIELPTFTCDEPATEVVEPTTTEPTDSLAAAADQGAATVASAAKNYPQQEDGDYWIVGELGTEKMTAGKTLLNMALKYYKDKNLFTYICTMNGITNPDIVPLDMELRIPELKDKKTGMTPIEVAEAAKNQ